MQPLGVFHSQPVHFGHFGQKCTSLGFFILSRYILVIGGENVPAGGFSFFGGTFWPFLAKMYKLWVFYSGVVHVAHFGPKSASWGFFILSRYIFAILGKKVPVGGFAF